MKLNIVAICLSFTFLIIGSSDLYGCQIPPDVKTRWRILVGEYAKRPSGSDLDRFYEQVGLLKKKYKGQSCVHSMSEAYELLRHEKLFGEKDIKKIIDNSARIPAAERIRSSDTRSMLDAIEVFVRRKMVRHQDNRNWEYLLGKTYYLKGENNNAKKIISNYVSSYPKGRYGSEAREMLTAL